TFVRGGAAWLTERGSALREESALFAEPDVVLESQAEADVAAVLAIERHIGLTGEKQVEELNGDVERAAGVDDGRKDAGDAGTKCVLAAFGIAVDDDAAEDEVTGRGIDRDTRLIQRELEIDDDRHLLELVGIFFVFDLDVGDVEIAQIEHEHIGLARVDPRAFIDERHPVDHELIVHEEIEQRSFIRMAKRGAEMKRIPDERVDRPLDIEKLSDVRKESAKLVVD